MIEATGVVIKIDKLGRITLPVRIRDFLGLEANESLEIFTDVKTDCIRLKRVSESCLKCGTDKNLKEIKCGYYICNNCIEEVNKTDKKDIT